MLELMDKLLSKASKPNPAVKTVSVDICDSFLHSIEEQLNLPKGNLETYLKFSVVVDYRYLLD